MELGRRWVGWRMMGAEMGEERMRERERKRVGERTEDEQVGAGERQRGRGRMSSCRWRDARGREWWRRKGEGRGCAVTGGWHGGEEGMREKKRKRVGERTERWGAR